MDTATSITEKLGGKLRFLREMHNYTQDYVASEIGVAPNTYSLMERGGREAQYTLDRLDKIAGLYQMNVTDLIKLSDQNIFHQVTNSAVHNVSDTITINNGLNEESVNLYKETIRRLEEQNDKLMLLIDKLTAKL